MKICLGQQNNWDDTLVKLDSPISPESLGHNFWLTRNYHGAGFWDMELGEAGDKLTHISHRFSEWLLYAGDDGSIHGCQG